MLYFNTIKPLLFALPPEFAHNLAIFGLKHNLLPKTKLINYPSLEQDLWGYHFDNPVGLAAGFDKNAEGINCLFNQGFGFIEVGTVTPRPQIGNAKPRIFRLTEDQAIINRLGFNNKGVKKFINNVIDSNAKGIVGINIGKNKLSNDPIEDYLTLLPEVYEHANYLTINISSPNTPNLRDFEQKDNLHALLSQIQILVKDLKVKYNKKVPLLVKISPDIQQKMMQDIMGVCLNNNIDGIIISNTTVKRNFQLSNTSMYEQGGLSGKPIYDISTKTLETAYKITQGKIPLIGVGGIFSGEAAYNKIKSGASLIQIYSVLIYKGFGVVEKIKYDLNELLLKDGFKNINEALGVGVKL